MKRVQIAAERKSDLKLLEAGEQGGGSHTLIPRNEDADDEEDGDSSEDDSDDEVTSLPHQDHISLSCFSGHA